MKIVVLDTLTFHFDSNQPWSFLEAFGDVELYETTPSDEAVIAERCAGAEIVLTNKVPLSRAVLSQLPDLRLVSVLATGYNIVDVAAAAALGVTVSNVPDYGSGCVAQHTLALMLELCNNVGLHHASVQAGDWTRSPVYSYWRKPVVELDGATVGFIGYGEIGARVGELVHALGAKVMAHSPSRRRQPAWQPFAWAEVEEIFAQADVVSLHCPQTPANTGFINAALLATMKPGAFLVNTARGGLIDENALAEALRNGQPGGAALDVVGTEPMREDCPLLGVPNCLLTPHVAWSGLPSRQRLLKITEANVREFLAGEPQHVVS